jgi:ABC-type bacteriocin/lantibiotic exporter with double-glycine peptidase domain
VGKSGSGKTTLVKTLVGLYNPTDGEIRINNIDLRKVPNSIKHHYINIVMQDPQFFNLSILDNLLIADPKASMREIDEACRLANIYDFIQSLEEKYDTVIGENGIKLSGGQRQRLAIARTVLMKPKVLIFDEATSALDSENEKMVVKAVKDLAQFMKVIVISHRLSSILNCDEVIIIRDGAVVEKVTIGDAMKKNVAFNEMFNREVQ